MFPLNGAVSLLSSDAVGVALTFQKLTSSMVVALDTASSASEILDTVGGSSE